MNHLFILQIPLFSCAFHEADSLGFSWEWVEGKRRLRKLGSLRQDNFGWGHGVAGETCCMCYKQFRHKKLMFAGGDLDMKQDEFGGYIGETVKTSQKSGVITSICTMYGEKKLLHVFHSKFGHLFIGSITLLK